MKKVNVKLSLKIGKVLGRSMSLTIKSNNLPIVEYDHFDQDVVIIEFKTEFPATIEFFTSGKTDSDCIIDSDNKIIEDMYVKITQFSIENISIKTWILEKYYFSGITDQNQSYNTNYLGYNGKTTVVLQGNSLFEYFLKMLATT